MYHETGLIKWTTTYPLQPTNMIDPIAFTIGPISVHWYGLLYGVGLVLALWILVNLNKKKPVFKNKDQIFDLAVWVFLLGVVIGGRLGYVLFYNFSFYLSNPIKIIAIWEGGMSFHGGLIGSAVVGYYYAKKHHLNYLALADMVVIPGALAQGIGRLGNFINGELVGRAIETEKWQWMGVNFGDGVLRYPSQLFQSASLMLLFIILLFIFAKKPAKGVVFFSYLTLNGFFRFLTEFWREPDSQIGFILNTFTLGQVLSFGLILIGLIGLRRQYR